ncbi:MAG: hypothetical protein R2694_15315 [Ilumatobacteraceae bacterium]
MSEDQVTPGTKFGDDLDADSLDLVELVHGPRGQFGIEVPEEELGGRDRRLGVRPGRRQAPDGCRQRQPRDGGPRSPRRHHRVRRGRPLRPRQGCLLGRAQQARHHQQAGHRDRRLGPHPYFANPKEARRGRPGGAVARSPPRPSASSSRSPRRG